MASNETNNTEDAVNRAYMALDKPVSSKERLDDKDDTWAVDMAKLGGIDVKERGHLGNLVSASGIVNLASASGRIGMGGKQDHKHKKGGGGQKGKGWGRKKRDKEKEKVGGRRIPPRLETCEVYGLVRTGDVASRKGAIHKAEAALVPRIQPQGDEMKTAPSDDGSTAIASYRRTKDSLAVLSFRGNSDHRDGVKYNAVLSPLAGLGNAICGVVLDKMRECSDNIDYVSSRGSQSFREGGEYEFDSKDRGSDTFEGEDRGSYGKRSISR